LLHVLEPGAEALEEWLDNRSRVVRAAIVYENDLPIFECLGGHAFKRRRQIRCSVERGNDYIDRRHLAYFPTLLRA
jgi:hypothetical protein